MSLRVAVQMDPLDRINIAGDSTFAIMLKAQELGHELFWYTPEDLSFAEGRLWTMGYPVTVQRVEGEHSSFGEPRILDLGRDVDVVLMRQDPPFDLGYITATHLLERIRGETLVVNDPASVRNAPEKVWVLDFPEFMPPTAVTRSLGLARKFLAEHGEIVVKPLHGFAGGSVFRIGSDGRNLASLIGAVQPHLSRAARPAEVHPGDRRGRQAHRAGRWRGRWRDQPGAGRGRDSLEPRGRRQGRENRADRDARKKSAQPRSRTAESGVCIFVGIDVIGGQWLTEINVTSPTGIVAIDSFNGTDTPALIWEAIDSRLAERQN